MTKPSLKAQLAGLKAGPRGDHTHRIASVLPDIEAAIARGVSRQTIHQTLQEDGIQVSFNGFAKTLYRLRKKAASSGTHKPGSTSPQTQAPPAAPTEQAIRPAPPKPFDPADIREIARNRPDLAELTRLGREATRPKADEAKKP